MTPQEFDSFAYGFDLNAANYNAGEFQNLVAGEENWTIQDTPVFSTRNGLEGVDFQGVSTGVVAGEHRALYECTILMIAKAPDAATHHLYGGARDTTNTFSLMINAYRGQAFIPNNASGFASAPPDSENAQVYAVTFSPGNGTTYAQIGTGAVVQNTQSSGEFNKTTINWPDAAIGQHRASFTTAWIARVLVFDRALHYRDNDNLQLLIAAEAARIGQ